MLIGQCHLIVVLERVGLISKTILGSKSYFLTKFLPSSLRLVIIGYLTLSLKREEELIYLPRRQYIGVVVKDIMVIASLGRTITLVVVRVGTR